MGDISNNCALQDDIYKVALPSTIKRFFVTFNFSLKTFCLKKLFDFSGFSRFLIRIYRVTHPVYSNEYFHSFFIRILDVFIGHTKFDIECFLYKEFFTTCEFLIFIKINVWTYSLALL